MKVAVCINLNNIFWSDRTINCLKRGSIRVWECKMFNPAARCKHCEPVEVEACKLPRYVLHIKGLCESLCANCMYGVLTVHKGVDMWFCMKTRRFKYGRVSRCMLFKPRAECYVEGSGDSSSSSGSSSNGCGREVTLERWLQ